jgi:signal transduction histidine kinase
MDMERMLGIMRERDHTGERFDAQPGLRRVQALAAQVTEAGLPVELTIDGTPMELAHSVDLSAYRIVQEALTNSLKHAGPARAHVVVRYGQTDLELEITDNGRGGRPGQGTSSGGRGLLGMRERVALFGGELRVGPRPEGGYRVWARLPAEKEEA